MSVRKPARLDLRPMTTSHAPCGPCLCQQHERCIPSCEGNVCKCHEEGHQR